MIQISCLAPLLLLLAPPVATDFPDGYVEEVVVTGLPDPVAFVHDASGRMYVAMRSGRIHVVENDQLVTPPLLDIAEEVGRWKDLGMLGFVLDPDFINNGHLYVSYLVDRHHLLHFEPLRTIPRRMSSRLRPSVGSRASRRIPARASRACASEVCCSPDRGLGLVVC